MWYSYNYDKSVPEEIFDHLKLIPVFLISYLTFILMIRFKKYEDKTVFHILISILIGCLIYIVTKIICLVNII